MAKASKPITQYIVAAKGAGFDSPVSRLDEDHLKRWPLARQVYSVAVDGPEDWSARVGLYGEWGTGKTSVLRFVASMAEQDGHIIVWFDPWAYANKADLWRAFVLNLCDTAERKLGGLSQAGDLRRKSYFDKARELLRKAAQSVPGDYGSAASRGLDLLRSAFAFSSADVLDLKKDLDGHRIVVLIDDLDRTAAELVPEILYSLKEVMDLPGFSFICGFDPKVVGKVLAAKHRGFGDGLKFLEKIIDYPVWLPPPSDDGLRRIAEADSAKYCAFIPSIAVHDALDFIPKNPRSVRKFVRLCALLKTQTARYNPEELNWHIILTCYAIKVHFPELDPDQVHSSNFYASISAARLMDRTAGESNQTELKVGEHAECCLRGIGIADPTGKAKACLGGALRRISDHLGSYWGDEERAIYQATLLERPHALTKREFDHFLLNWKGEESVSKLGQLVADHSREQNFHISAVAEFFVKLLIAEFQRKLSKAEQAHTEQDRAEYQTHATEILSCLEVFALRPGNLSPDLQLRNWIPLELVILELINFADNQSVMQQQLWPQVDTILSQLVATWDGPFEMMLGAVRSVEPHGKHGIEGPKSTAMAGKLNDLIDDQLSNRLIAGVRECDFFVRIATRRSGTDDVRNLIINPKSSLWIKHTDRLVTAFSEPNPTDAIERNAYRLLLWIQDLLKQGDSDEKVAGKSLAGHAALMQAVWRAATTKPFLGRHALRIKAIPDMAKELGTILELPPWWQPAIDYYFLTMDAGTTRDKVELGPDNQEA